MSTTQTAPTITSLQADQATAKAALKQARTDKADDDTVATLKREVDRIGAALRRMAKSDGTRKPAEKPAKAKAAAKPKAASAPKAPKEPKAPRISEPVPGEKRLKVKADPESLMRTDQGNFHRVTRKTRKVGVHLSVYDLALRPAGDRRFAGLDISKSRWIIVCEETGQFIYAPTWSGCGQYITNPDWLDEDAIAAGLPNLPAHRQPVASE